MIGKKTITSLYDYDEIDQTYVIKISTNNYLDLFNKLDYYPILKRDIDTAVMDYMEDCSDDIPLRKKIKIEIGIKQENRDDDLEMRTIKALKNNLLYILDFYRKSSLSTINSSLIYAAMFVVLNLVTFWFESVGLNSNSIFFRTLIEGFSIGSWVFLWEALAGVVFKNKDNRHSIRIYKRLLESKIFFSYY